MFCQDALCSPDFFSLGIFLHVVDRLVLAFTGTLDRANRGLQPNVKCYDKSHGPDSQHKDLGIRKNAHKINFTVPLDDVYRFEIKAGDQISSWKPLWHETERCAIIAGNHTLFMSVAAAKMKFEWWINRSFMIMAAVLSWNAISSSASWFTSDFLFGGLIGEGLFGKVYHAKIIKLN